jgi:hypothetical protein
MNLTNHRRELKMAEEKSNEIPKRVVPASEPAKTALEKAVAASKELAAKAAADKAAQLKKGVVVVKSLRVRKDHSVDAEMVAGLVRDDEVTIHETWTDGKNTWVKIGADQWAAMIFEGETYIKLA